MPGSLQILVSSFFIFGNLSCEIFFTMVSVCKARQAGLLKNVNKHFCNFVSQNQQKTKMGFSPCLKSSLHQEKKTEKLEESRLSKRYAVNPARKSYKIPKWRILFYIILCTDVKCKNWLSHNNLLIVIYFETNARLITNFGKFVFRFW